MIPLLTTRTGQFMITAVELLPSLLSSTPTLLPMISLLLASLAFAGRTAAVPDAPLPTAPTPHDLYVYLDSIANYTSFLNISSNSLSNDTVSFNSAGGTDHIFVNANLARVLLATWRIQNASSPWPNANYLKQGLAWCDTFVSLQASITSSRGNPAGYWGAGYGEPNTCKPPLRGDCAHGGNIYFGDTGTAVTTLALCHRLSPTQRYLDALVKYATFVLEGCSTPPVNKKGTSTGFVDLSTGAIGCGYYGCTGRTADDCSKVEPAASKTNCPSHAPYTIATGTTGGAFFAELYSLTQNQTFADVATTAMEYEARVVLSTGEVPYILDGANCSSATPKGCAGTPVAPGVGGPWTFDTISYTVEGVAGIGALFPTAQRMDPKKWKSTVDFLLRTQGPEGYWGTLDSSDIFRSPRCLTLLTWWLRAVETPTYKDKPVRATIARYLAYILGEGGKPRGEYGMMWNMITHGMVGLAVADEIQFGASF